MGRKAKPIKRVTHPRRSGPTWKEDQIRFDVAGVQPAFRSQNPCVPASYELDLEFACFVNADNLANATRGFLRYAEGRCRFVSDKDRSWGHHAWCVRRGSDEIVDPYFEWKFPGRTLEYQEGDSDGIY